MQASALVHIYLDGSVLVAQAGIEMGQGLHTKIIQVIFINETYVHVITLILIICLILTLSLYEIIMVLYHIKVVCNIDLVTSTK